MSRVQTLTSSVAFCLLGCTPKLGVCPPVAVSVATVAETPESTGSPSFEASLQQFTIAQAVVTWIALRDRTTPSLFFYTDRADMSPARFQAAPSPVPGVPGEVLHSNDVSSWRGLELTVESSEFRAMMSGALPVVRGQQAGGAPEALLTVVFVVRGAAWAQSFAIDRTERLERVFLDALAAGNNRGREVVRRHLDIVTAP